MRNAYNAETYIYGLFGTERIAYYRFHLFIGILSRKRVLIHSTAKESRQIPERHSVLLVGYKFTTLFLKT